MKTYLDCIPCFFKQTLFAARAAVDDEETIKTVLDKIGIFISSIPLEQSPPETSRFIYRTVREVTGVDDPFADLKAESISRALSLYPQQKERIGASEDPVETAVRMAIAGNVIDFGANPDFQLEQDMEAILQTDPVINHYHSLQERLRTAERVVFIGDNAGETVFDKLLIEVMGRPVVYVVRDGPIINDATMEDAVQSGLDEVATIVSSGWDGPGISLKDCSQAFLTHYTAADLIISKGQGNYETLSAEQGPMFHLLKAKCPVIATNLGVKEGDTVIKYALGGQGRLAT